MKNSVLLIGFVLFTALGSFAQSNKEDVDMIQSIYGKSKKDRLLGRDSLARVRNGFKRGGSTDADP